MGVVLQGHSAPSDKGQACVAANSLRLNTRKKHPSSKETKFSKELKLHISLHIIYCFSRAISSPSSPYEQA